MRWAAARLLRRAASSATPSGALPPPPPSPVHEWAVAHKDYEAHTAQQRLAPHSPALVRLDGHRFSRFTSGFHKPYDWRILWAMTRAAADLLEALTPQCAYTQSDEITLVWAQAVPEKAVPFGGKTHKLVSLAAALCSVRFAHHLLQLLRPDDPLRERVAWVNFGVCARLWWLEAGVGLTVSCRRSRIQRAQHGRRRREHLVAPRGLQGLFVFRACLFCLTLLQRNSCNTLGSLYFSTRQRHECSPSAVREMLRAGPGVHWEDMHPAFRYGTLLKRQQFTRVGLDVRTGHQAPVARSRTAWAAMDWSATDAGTLATLMALPRLPEDATEWREVAAVPEPLLGRRAAVLWDLDGTLVDTEGVYGAVTRALWPQVATLPDAKALRGRSERENMALIAAHLGLANTDAMLLQRDQRLREVLADTPPRTRPGALRLARHLATSGVPMALVTSSRRELVAAKLGPQLLPLFERCLWICDGDASAAKPSPAPFVEAARRLGVEPHACLVLEDSAAGVAGARAAAMPVVWAGDGPAPADALALSGGLTGLVPHLLGLPAYEAHDEGIAAWKARRMHQ